MTYQVMTQSDGGTPQFEASFSSELEAIDLIYSMGGETNDTARVPGNSDDDPDTLIYNLGREPGCRIAWIETAE